MFNLESADRPIDSMDRLTAGQWRMVILASLGGALEFYDFVIYGIFAAFIGRAFFPVADPLVTLALSFAIFAIGYLSRPLGGVILGYFGDRYGRRPVFILSVMVVSVSTLAMGILPTYASWGLTSTALMIALRLLQGFCLGGEMPGSITYVVETVPRRAGFVCAFVFFCVNLGVLFGAGVNLAIHYLLSPDSVVAYGWRIAFVIGGAFGLLSFWMRRKLEETPEFSTLKHGAAKHPLKEVVRDHWRPLLAAVCMTASVATFNGLMFAHMPAYLEKILHYDARHSALAENIGLVALSVSILVFGWLSDRIPRHKILRIGAGVVLVACYPFYVSLENRSVDLVLLLVLAGCAGGLASGTFGSVIADMFPTRVRFSGIALSYNIGFTLFSGTVPWIATSLIKTLDSAVAPALIMAACAALTLVATFLVRPMAGNIVRGAAERT